MTTLHTKDDIKFDIDGSLVLLSDMTWAHEYNPHKVRPFIIGNEFGALVVVWASHEQEALDSAVDANMLDCLMAEDQTHHDNESLTPLGNASELFNLEYVWIKEVEFNPARDYKLMLEIQKRYSEGEDTL